MWQGFAGGARRGRRLGLARRAINGFEVVLDEAFAVAASQGVSHEVEDVRRTPSELTGKAAHRIGVGRKISHRESEHDMNYRERRFHESWLLTFNQVLRPAR